MKCVYDKWGVCPHMVPEVWSSIPASNPLSFWPFMAAFLCFCIVWAIAQTVLSPFIKREGDVGMAAKVLAAVVGLVGGIFGEHVIIGMYYGVSGQLLLSSAASQTHQEIAGILGNAFGVFGIIGNIVRG